MVTIERVGRRGRSSKPERIPMAGGDTAVRNDIVALEVGETERTLNKGDREGAPYVYFGGVKYRPINEFRAFRSSKIVRQGQQRRRRRA
jgi:hypothetical protein